MPIQAKIIEDSLSEDGFRLTTFQITLPKALLAELNTHRALSKNAASSRAIPSAKFNQLESWYPLRWGKNQSGMQASQDNLEGENLEKAQKIWQDCIDYCKSASQQLAELGLHKQWANRMNDWHVLVDDIITGTDWDNFFNLRIHPAAQPEMDYLAAQMKQLLMSNKPKVLKEGKWHLPFVTEEERKVLSLKDQLVVSTARCCRVSYNNHGGTLSTLEQDYNTYEKLGLHQNVEPKHASPCEHQATPDFLMNVTDSKYNAKKWYNAGLHGNFEGWCQHRKIIEFEELQGFVQG